MGCPCCIRSSLLTCNALQVKVREKLGNDGYIETAWLPCEADAEAALTATASRNADDPSASSRIKPEAREAVSGVTYKGRCRMSSCHSSQMGRKAMP